MISFKIQGQANFSYEFEIVTCLYPRNSFLGLIESRFVPFLCIRPSLICPDSFKFAFQRFKNSIKKFQVLIRYLLEDWINGLKGFKDFMPVCKSWRLRQEWTGQKGSILLWKLQEMHDRYFKYVPRRIDFQNE